MTDAKPHLTVEDIKRVVGEHFGVTVAQIDSKSRERFLILPRFAAYWFSANLLRFTYVECGRRFGKDHGSIMHGCRVVNDQLQVNPKMKRSMGCLWDKLRETGRVEVATQMSLDETLLTPATSVAPSRS